MARRLTTLVREAGRAILEIHGRTDLGERAKADESPVTTADLMADSILFDGLTRAFPGVPVVTEERAETHDAGLGGTHFLVDPLDGTREFVARRGEFTVNVALIDNGLPTAGVVYAPVIGRLFRTASGGGAVEEGPDGAERPIRVVAPDLTALRVVASRSHRDSETQAYLARLSVGRTLAVGSSLKFGLIASGEADLYPRFGRTMEWDTAAGHAVLDAAGGSVKRVVGGGALSYGKPGRENPPFVASALRAAPQ